MYSKATPSESTSCAAAAIWSPYLSDDERITPWSETTRLVLERLARIPVETGVRCVFGHEAARDIVAPPAWATDLPDFRVSISSDLPAGFTSGWWYRAPVVDMPPYLDYLMRRLLAHPHATMERRTVNTLAELLAVAPIVVNCSGVGARDLLGDADLTPVRGQLVVVENPGIDEFFVEHDESPAPTYYIPHGDQVVLGGSADEHRVDLEPDRAISEGILARCAVLEPRLAGATVIDHRVGLRPTRPRVRLEVQELPGGHVVHNYGHGGSGVTVSWGCAQESAALASELLR